MQVLEVKKFILCFEDGLSNMYIKDLEHPIIRELVVNGERNKIKIAGFGQDKFQKDLWDPQFYDIVTVSDKRFEEICGKRTGKKGGDERVIDGKS